MKKWLNAVWVSRENIFKSWEGKVSYDITDVSVPENTIFYFFSNEKVDMELIQLNLTEHSNNLWIKKLDGLVINNKIYCCGKKEKNDLVLIKSGKSNEGIIVKDFFDTLRFFNFEFV